MEKFSALTDGSITLHLIEEDNLPKAYNMFAGFPDSEYMLGELERSCKPKYDKQGRRTKFGFYSLLENELAGLSVLGISSWENLRGYTGADTLIHMRGQGIAPGSKPHLFYLAFKILGLNRVETGCVVSNISSKKSIEKIKGLKFEGVLRQFTRNSEGIFEDEYRYSILKDEWLSHYDESLIRKIK